MRMVRQKHKNGCAIAALAMLTGIGYSKVYKKVHPKVKPRQSIVGTHIEHTLKFLHKVGINYRLSFKKINIQQLKNNTYLSVNTKCGGRHAMVWDAKSKKLIDPQGARSYYMTFDYIKKHLNYIIEFLD
jgi:ABC-type bacteriocin/lantibiotic exporter with double-glycine peptidase domain